MMRVLQTTFFLLLTVLSAACCLAADSAPTRQTVVGKIIELSEAEKMIQIRNKCFIVNAIEILTADNQVQAASFSDLQTGLIVIVDASEAIKPYLLKADLVTIPEDQASYDEEGRLSSTRKESTAQSTGSTTDDNSYEAPAAKGNVPKLVDGVWTN